MLLTTCSSTATLGYPATRTNSEQFAGSPQLLSGRSEDIAPSPRFSRALHRTLSSESMPMRAPSARPTKLSWLSRCKQRLRTILKQVSHPTIIIAHRPGKHVVAEENLSVIDRAFIRCREREGERKASLSCSRIVPPDC